MSKICNDSPIFEKVLDKKKKLKNIMIISIKRKEITLSRCGKYIIMIYG